MRRLAYFLIASWATVSVVAQDAQPAANSSAIRSAFHIKYVSLPNVYIDAGRDAGLSEGTQLVLKQDPTKSDKDPSNTALEAGVIAKLTVVSIASTSAVCEIRSSTRDPIVGDIVALPDTEIEKAVEKSALGNTRQYPIVVSFNEGDPLDEEVRETIPRPPLPEINQIRGRLGFDSSMIRQFGDTPSTSKLYGFVFRADFTRIFGTHWNLSGYWRGQLRSTPAGSQATLQDLMNRTYLMSLSYINPESRWTAGIGRLYLPFASSLETIDGAYLGLQSSSRAVLNIFAGSTPDPTAWNYDPQRRIGGAYFNVRGGNYDRFHFSTTLGGGVEMQKWTISRPFGFTENTISYKRGISLYHAMQFDQPASNPSSPDIQPGLGRNLVSLRIQATSRVTLDITENYFRDVPTWDPALVGTGLLDKYLYQGINGGARVQLPEHIIAYFSVGHSSNSGDANDSLNRMYGVTLTNIANSAVQVDARYSRFHSAFADGKYTTFTVSRSLLDRFNLNAQVGDYAYSSPLATTSASSMVNLFVDTNLGSRLFMESMYTLQRGGTLNYDQWTTTVGYRFDNRGHGRRSANAQDH